MPPEKPPEGHDAHRAADRGRSPGRHPGQSRPSRDTDHSIPLAMATGRRTRWENAPRRAWWPIRPGTRAYISDWLETPGVGRLRLGGTPRFPGESNPSRRVTDPPPSACRAPPTPYVNTRERTTSGLLAYERGASMAAQCWS